MLETGGVYMPRALVHNISNCILEYYEKYLSDFLRITRKAKWRFEHRDWQGRHKDALSRFDLYERSLEKVGRCLEVLMGNKLYERDFWTAVKGNYQKLIKGRYDIEIARTYYNSVTRKIFHTIGLDRDIEYFSLELAAGSGDRCEGICTRYPESLATKEIIYQIMYDHRFHVEYEDIERDCELVAREIDLQLWPILGFDKHRSIEVIIPVFYRNKAAYVIGRIIADDHILPLVLPMYNGERGIYIDTVLMSESEVSTVFSFAYSYFHVDAARHDILIDFLRTILPDKPVAELYTSIGFNKPGKTEFYRDLHKFVHESHEKFVIAPGKEGAVMIVFTLPDFNFVFKVIKDRPCFLRSREMTSKIISRDEVRARYDFVCHRDRVGRMVDTQEFENLRFRRKRFSTRLLREFKSAAAGIVTVDDEYVVIRHLYVQRKVLPLPIYLLAEKNAETIRKTIIDFGYFLKDLAATGIFPSDIFNTWNYGVTLRERVVLFDYDDVIPLENIRFREKPRPHDEQQEMDLEENWIVAGTDDYFLDEIYKYTGIPEPLKGIFREIHSDLLTSRYWRVMLRRVRNGEIMDITPYDRSKRFRNRKVY